MHRLIIKQLKKKFNDVWAVKNLDFQLEPGEIFVLLGPNGAGKTTTLKLIAGLLHPDEGEIFIEGIDVKKDPIKAKSFIGYIPDEPFIYDKLTGREFLNFVASAKNISVSLVQHDISRWIDFFNLSAKANEFQIIAG